MNIIGARDGYFNDVEEFELIKELKNLKPEILLVGFGSPSQEVFMNKDKEELPCKVMIGVEDSFDVMSGTLRRAPKWIRKIGFEWFHRLVLEPTSIKRLSVIYNIHPYLYKRTH